MSEISRVIGDPATFAIQFSIDPLSHATPARRWGNVLMWVHGNMIGDPEVFEEVGLDIQSLARFAEQDDKRQAATASATAGRAASGGDLLLYLMSIDPARAIDEVMWGKYGDPNPELEKRFGDGSALWPFEILPQASAFFTGWQAILLEGDRFERFLWRRRGCSTHVWSWPRGTFLRVTKEAEAELLRIA